MSNFLEITSNDNWFKLHPGKIAGVEYETTSFYFPIMVKGTKEDVYRVTGIIDAVRVPTGTPIEIQDNAKLPNELHRIVENGLQVPGVTKITFSDNFKTMDYGTKTAGTIVSVIGKEVDAKADYDFEKRNYLEEKSKDFDADIKETEQSRLNYSEKTGIVKMLKQRKKHLPVIEKIILPFYEYHLGIDPDKEKRMRLLKVKAKAIKIKLLLMETEVEIKKFKVGQIVFSEKHQQFFKIKKVSKSLTNKSEFIYDVSSIEKDKKAINMPYETFEGFDYFNDVTKKYVTKFQDLENKREVFQATYDVVEKNLRSEQDLDYRHKELSKYDEPITVLTKDIKEIAERFSEENKISLNHSWGIALTFTTILKNK